ncbi:MAG: GspE/PulE family protein, partial [Gammaproteobacteria bacterium]|nr:GspE/PulE family protein [Gammaproteobacteria bacterium]
MDTEALARIPQEILRANCVMPLMRHQGCLVVAMQDPSSSDTLRTLSVVAGMSIIPVLATPNDIHVAIATHCPPFDDAALLAEAEHLGRAHGNQQEQMSAERLAQQQPIVRLVSNMLHDAIQRRASDIHIRPREHKARILYRIDGTLIRIREFSRDLLPVIAARIKVIAAMDVAEHRSPQDGSIHLNAGERSVDLRVSVMPSIYGENVVIRVLDRSVGLRRITDIGFTPSDEQRFRTLINRNQGLVLVTGPTGSGKTTTLYAAMQELNTGDDHILTVEDPVEYRLDGIVQTQVNPAIDYSFSSALRHILRHDPDIILIGEIRDVETARVAMESALTGHVVMSTLHTNSATQTITRLLQMGIDPYLVNATLAGVLAQRLVRRNCEHCKAPETVDAAIRDSLGVKRDEPFFRGKGCDECHGT